MKSLILIVLVVVLFAIYFNSCCSLPGTTPLTKSEDGKIEIIEVEKDKPYKNIKNNIHKLPRYFEILSWNGLAGGRKIFKNITGLKFDAFKCSAEEWDNIFYDLLKEKDIVLIQEAYIDESFLNLLETADVEYSWNMARSFITDWHLPNGVLTISTAEAESVYPILECEPVLPTPKSALFTTFGFKNDDSVKLLVVNVHAVLMGSKNFKHQLKNIKRIIDKHNGPVILAGDFNTMSESRTKELDIFTKGSKKLSEVKLNGDQDKRVKLYDYPIDFIFYRGLVSEKAYVIDLKEEKGCKVSDHNPIVAKFRLKRGE